MKLASWLFFDEMNRVRTVFQYVHALTSPGRGFASIKAMIFISSISILTISGNSYPFPHTPYLAILLIISLCVARSLFV
jgi:hypothetical protein